ncbi:MAG TPA: hypothetical protein VIK91_22470 [Nannocystis sp.]
MNCSTLRFLFASTLALSLTSIACNPREPAGSATATETDSTTTEGTAGTTTTSNEPTTSLGPTTTAGTDSGTASDATTTTTGTPTTTDTTATTAPACADPPSQPINSSCTDDSGCGCDTGKCFVVPILGGYCGECLVDADCENGGCSVPNPIAGIGATCNSGGPGEGCMTDDVCSDPDHPHCGTLLNAAPIIVVKTCGQCKVNADCTNPEAPNCTPTYDVENFKGQLNCVPDGSVPNNDGCSLENIGGEPAGNKACMSGHCGTADVMAVLKVGVCGECSSDADCQPGQQCTDPQVDLENGALVGSVCM